MKNVTYISASAGSGKTTEIVKRLVNAIENEGVQPSQIIMTTFTRAAAQEMRERAKKGLLEAHMPKEANEIGAALIGTIHSVCLSFLQKYWYLAGISPDTQEMDENDFKLYVDRSLFEFVSESDMQRFEQWRKVLNITHYTGGKTSPYVPYWRDWLRTMVDKARYYHIEDLKGSRQKSIEEIERTWSLIQFNQDEYDRCRKELIENIPQDQRFDNFKKYVEAFDPTVDKLDSAKISKSKKIETFVQDWVNEVKRGCFSDSAKSAAINIVNRLFDILEQWQDRYAEYKKSHRMLDFNDMELYFCQLLDYPEVQEELKRYKLVLVDEFQDSNPLQIDMFQRLSNLVERSIWVGDPKQAIYGFRGTDSEWVQEVSELIRKGENNCACGKPLESSYRSRPGLVSLVNDEFQPIFSQHPFNMHDDEIKLKAAREEHLGDLDVAQTWTLYGKTETWDQCLAKYIRELIASGRKVEPKNEPIRPVLYRDIAILTRDNKTAAAIADALQQWNIPAFVPETEDGDTKPIEKALLMALTQYKLSWKYRPHLRADLLHLLKDLPTEVLLNDYFGSVQLDENGKCQRDSIRAWKTEDALIQEIDRIVDQCRAKGLYDTLTAYVDRLRLYDVVRKWNHAEVRQSNINAFLQLAQAYDTHCEVLEIEQPTYADFTQYIKKAKSKTELNLASNSVKVLTMHKSKGLEWPIVIYYSKEKRNEQNLFCGVSEQRIKGNRYWLRVFPNIGSDRSEGKQLCALLSDAEYLKAAREREDAEEQRLRYVSYTRARDLLVLLDFEKDEFTDKPGLENVPKYQLINTAETQQEGSELTYLVSPSKNTSGKCDIQTDTIDAKRISLALSDEELVKRMDIIGSCIHNIYAAYDPAADKKATTDMAANIISSYNLSTAIKAEDVVEAIESLYKYLNTQYGQPTSVAHEVPFSIKRENGQLLRGEIDLLWHTPDGVVLVDYKNTKKEEANPEHYAGQMAAYREAIEASGLALKGIVLFYATLGKIINLTIH